MSSTRTALALLLVLASGGCGGTADPTVTAASADIEDGQALYETSCARCHGIDLRGTDGGPSFLSPIYRPDHHGDGAFLLAATRGVPPHHWDFGAMPPVEGLSQPDIAAMTAYVRAVQEAEGFDE